MNSDPFALASQPQNTEHCFLVVVDKSEEMFKALRFACRRAKKVDGKVALLGIITRSSFEHWVSIGELMKEEAREEIDRLMAVATERAEELSGKSALTYVREGDPVDVITNLLRDEQNLKLLVLAADTQESRGPGPLVSAFSSKAVAQCRVPVTIVPGNLTDDEIDAIC
mgnify:CR=1 FL=1